MEDLIFLIIALFIGTVYDVIMREEPKEVIATPIHNINTPDIIKNKLLWIYNSDIEDKREKIVSLLLQLERLEDTDNFFEKHDYVRSYIFNST